MERKNFCTNCGGNGHIFRQCIAPVTSYGVIMVRSANQESERVLSHGGSDSVAERVLSHGGSEVNIAENLGKTPGLVTGMENVPLEFLLILRRDSLGFIELMRGKYKVNDVPYIKLHLAGITEEERQKYKAGPFEEIWNGMWGMDHSHLYKNEYEIAKAKWEQIQRGVTDNKGKLWTLDEMIATSGPAQKTPEWGFPKGRRDAQESDFVCAMREMYEETGVKEDSVIPIQNMEPLVESFLGTNHVHYCHKYFIVWVPNSVKIEFDIKNDHMRREIGDLRWFSLNNALECIRAENLEKREVLLRAASLFRNMCAFPLR